MNKESTKYWTKEGQKMIQIASWPLVARSAKWYTISHTLNIL